MLGLAIFGFGRYFRPKGRQKATIAPYFLPTRWEKFRDGAKIAFH